MNGCGRFVHEKGINSISSHIVHESVEEFRGSLSVCLHDIPKNSAGVGGENSIGVSGENSVGVSGENSVVVGGENSVGVGGENSVGVVG